MSRIMWGLVSLAIAVPIGLLLAYLEVRQFQRLHYHAIFGLVVAIACGVMWLIDRLGFMPDTSQATTLLSLSAHESARTSQDAQDANGSK